MLEKIDANSAFNPIKVDFFYYQKLFHTAIFSNRFLRIIYIPASVKAEQQKELKNATENIQLMYEA